MALVPCQGACCKGQLQVNEEMVTNKQLAAVTIGGIDRAAAVARPRRPGNVHILVTLYRFDDFEAVRSYSGPFIPCERRHAD